MAAANFQFSMDGVTLNEFHPTLPFAYIRGRIAMPTIEAPASGIPTIANSLLATWDFTIPSDIVKPMFFMVGAKSRDLYYSFLHVSESTWRVVIIGKALYYPGPITQVPPPIRVWTNPVTQAGDTYIVYGGYRG